MVTLQQDKSGGTRDSSTTKTVHTFTVGPSVWQCIFKETICYGRCASDKSVLTARTKLPNLSNHPWFTPPPSNQIIGGPPPPSYAYEYEATVVAYTRAATGKTGAPEKTVTSAESIHFDSVESMT